MAPLGVLTDASAGQGFDGGLAAGGDVRGDGVSDLVLASPSATGGAGQIGRVTVAAVARAEIFGAGCEVSGPTAPELRASGRPVLGGAFDVATTRFAPTPAVGLLALSARPAMSIPINTCLMHVDPLTLTVWSSWVVTSGVPRLDSIPIPNVPALLFGQAMMQAWFLETTSGALVASNGIVLRLGL